MISFVPSPLEDELPYGFVGRWFLLSGFDDFFCFSFAALGVMPDLTSVGNPLSEGLFSACGQLVSGEDVGRRHTLLPFFSTLLSTHDYACLVSGAPYDGDLGFDLGVGFREQRFARLKYCPQCAECQEEEHGFATWLRAPNLPGVVACWKHGCSLLAVPVKAFQTPLLVPRTHNTSAVRATIPGEVWYANEARNLLVSSAAPISGLQFRKVLRDACHLRFKTNHGILTRDCKVLVAQRMAAIEWPRLVENLQKSKGLMTERVLTDCLTGRRKITPALGLLLALLAYEGKAKAFFAHAAQFKDLDDLREKELRADSRRAEYDNWRVQSWIERDLQALGDKMFG